MLIEFTNTIFSNLQLIEILNDFYLDRNSTMPLEHKFGMVRIRCKDINTFNKFKITLAELQSYNLLNEGEKVEGRKSFFGCIVNKNRGEFFDEDETFSVHDFSPKDIVDCVMKISGFKENDGDLAPIQWFIDLLTFLETPPSERKNYVSSRDLELGVHEGYRAKILIKRQKSFTNYFHAPKKTPYEKFTEKFRKKFKRELCIEDLCKIIRLIKKSFPDINIKIPTNKKKEKEMREWLQKHIGKFESFILKKFDD